KMAFGNKVGFKFTKDLEPTVLFNPVYGGFVLELAGGTSANEAEIIGVTRMEPIIESADCSKMATIEELQKPYEDRLEKVFPCNIETSSEPVEAYAYQAAS